VLYEYSLVVGYDDLFKAEEVRLKLWKMEKDHLVDVDDAAVAEMALSGKVEAEPSSQSHTAGAVSGGSYSIESCIS
jgi:uncharacterized membrane protein